MHAIRPKNMFAIGDCLYPDGNPAGTSDPAWHDSYKEQGGTIFSIVYTSRQMRDNATRNGAFMPFMPLVILGGPLT